MVGILFKDWWDLWESQGLVAFDLLFLASGPWLSLPAVDDLC